MFGLVWLFMEIRLVLSVHHLLSCLFLSPRFSNSIPNKCTPPRPKTNQAKTPINQKNQKLRERNLSFFLAPSPTKCSSLFRSHFSLSTRSLLPHSHRTSQVVLSIEAYYWGFSGVSLCFPGDMTEMRTTSTT